MPRTCDFFVRNTFAGFVAVCLLSCSPENEHTEYPTLVGRFPTETLLEPLIADQAYIGDFEFFVRFRRGKELYYGGGEWASRIDLQEVKDTGRAGPYIVPLGYQQFDRWNLAPNDVMPARILSIADWQMFRDQLFTALLPQERRTGIVLDFGVDDYFLYYDSDGVFQATVIQQKPGDYNINRRVAFSEFMRLGWPTFDAFLSERGITERRVAFNTGDTGDYSLPFIYVNRDLRVVAFVRRPPQHFQYPRGSKSGPFVQTAGHFAQSHLGGIVLRPISSVYRLFFVAADTVAETVTPDWIVSLERTPIPSLAGGPSMDLDQWEVTLDRLTGRSSSRGTIDYLVDGEEFFTRFIDAASSATSSISLRAYIFDNDDYASKIGELLKRRSNDDIDVKVLLDGLGTIISTIEKQETLPQDYEGPASVHKFLERHSRVDVRQASNPWLTGDHVKTMIIDKNVAFTGGMNIAREYRYDWHDLMMELHGPVVDILQQEFDRAWAHAGLLGDIGYFFQRFRRKPHNTEDLGFPVRVLFTRIDDPEIFHAQRLAIRNARRYVYVENAYFTDDAMLYELAKARRRGVDVRVIMPLVTDRGPITRNNVLAANAMLEHGIRVFVYPGMSHVKAAIFDGWACLGTANWDKLSFRMNKELNIATSHPEAVDRLKESLFEADFDRSLEITEPFPVRWSDHLLELLGDYIF
jgi:cardiolipin synthase